MLRALPITIKGFDLRHLPATIVNTLLTWQARASERHMLSELDDRLLNDMGLTRQQALDESYKPFWRI